MLSLFKLEDLDRLTVVDIAVTGLFCAFSEPILLVSDGNGSGLLFSGTTAAGGGVPLGELPTGGVPLGELPMGGVPTEVDSLSCGCCRFTSGMV